MSYSRRGLGDNTLVTFPPGYFLAGQGTCPNPQYWIGFPDGSGQCMTWDAVIAKWGHPAGPATPPVNYIPNQIGPTDPGPPQMLPKPPAGSAGGTVATNPTTGQQYTVSGGGSQPFTLIPTTPVQYTGPSSGGQQTGGSPAQQGGAAANPSSSFIDSAMAWIQQNPVPVIAGAAVLVLLMVKR